MWSDSTTNLQYTRCSQLHYVNTWYKTTYIEVSSTLHKYRYVRTYICIAYTSVFLCHKYIYIRTYVHASIHKTLQAGNGCAHKTAISIEISSATPATLPSAPKWNPASVMYTNRRLAGLSLQPMICRQGLCQHTKGVHMSMLHACVHMHVCVLCVRVSVCMCVLELTSSQTTACSIPSIPPSGESRLPEIIRSFTAV